MKPLVAITSKDVTFLLSPTLMIDGLWEAEFKKPVDERIRRVALDLIHLLAKHKIVPKWLLREHMRTTYSICLEAADERIAEALKLNMITELVPAADKRQRLYGFTEEQRTKLRNIQKGTILAYKTALIQSQAPDDPTYGQTKDNKSWYRNALATIATQGEKYKEIAARLKPIMHLLGVALLVAVVLFGLANANSGVLVAYIGALKFPF